MQLSPSPVREIPEKMFWTRNPNRQLTDKAKGDLSNEFLGRCWRHHYKKLPDWDGSNSRLAGDERRRYILDTLREYLVGKTVFEVGAGRGFFSNKIREWGYEVTTTDFAVGSSYYDVTKEPWRGQFDNVIALGVFQHILSWHGILNAMKNVRHMALRRIIISVMVREKIRNNYTSIWPSKVYYELGELVREIEHTPYAVIMVFDAE